jgi:hypothetical protein
MILLLVRRLGEVESSVIGEDRRKEEGGTRPEIRNLRTNRPTGKTQSQRKMACPRATSRMRVARATGERIVFALDSREFIRFAGHSDTSGTVVLRAPRWHARASSPDQLRSGAARRAVIIPVPARRASRHHNPATSPATHAGEAQETAPREADRGSR